jgi:hypothetical protein
MSNESEPLQHWSVLRNSVIGRNGKPVSQMTMFRWKNRGVISTTLINGQNYLRVHETLARLASSAADTTS